MQLVFEIIPVFLFFIAFKIYGIYVATQVGIIATLLQVLIYRLLKGTWDRKQLVTLGVFVFFGGLTLYFHNPIFVKWKPTIVFWLFAFIMLGYQMFTPKPLMQRLMEGAVKDKTEISLLLWKKVNLAWALFFMGLGSVNLYIAYFFSNDAWVNFKFYGITGALFIFSILQAICLSLYLKSE